MMQSTSRSSASSLKSSVIKKLKPGAPGTLRWVERFGDNLMCVRYRIDEAAGRRYTTVELLVDDRATDRTPSGAPDRLIFLRVGVGEREVQQKIRAAGGKWNPKECLWILPYRKAKALKLLPRLVKNVD